MSEATPDPLVAGTPSSSRPCDGEIDRMAEKLCLWLSPVLLFYAGLLAFDHGQRAPGLLLAGLFVALHVGLAAHRRGRLSATRLGLATVWLAVGVGCWARGGVTAAALHWHAFVVVALWLARRPRPAAGYALAATLQLVVVALADVRGLLGDEAPATLLTVQLTGAASYLALVLLVVLMQQRIRLAHDTSERLRQRVFQLNEIAGAARLGGRVAHEVNNVLAVVGAHAEALGDELPEGSPLHGDVRAIRGSVNAGAALTRRLLAAARVEPAQGRVPLDFAPLLDVLVQRVAQELPPEVTLRSELRGDALRVAGDAWELEQLADALLANATAALSKGGTLVVRSQLRHEPMERELRYGNLASGDYVVLEVADDGVGIDAKALPRLVQPFYSERDEVDSAGLGLALVHGVASAMGGQLDARSTLGKGSTFTVYLPALPASASLHALSVPSGPRRRLQVLLVEDDELVRKAVARLLRLDGHEIAHAATGPEALRWASSPDARFDVLLTDVVMPELDGFALARALRERRPELPVVYVSGFAGDAATRGRRVPGSEFLEKPVSRDALRRALARVVPVSRAAEAG